MKQRLIKDSSDRGTRTGASSGIGKEFAGKSQRRDQRSLWQARHIAYRTGTRHLTGVNFSRALTMDLSKRDS